MKKFFKYFLIVLPFVLAIAVYLNYPKLAIINGYTAKNMCSCVFIANRNAKNVEENDLNYSLLKYSSVKVNKEEESVTSTLLGMGKQTAYYNPSTGCAVITEKEKDAFLNFNYNLKNADQIIDTLNWPYSNKVLFNDTLFSSNLIDRVKLKKAVNTHFLKTKEDKENNIDRNTRAVVVVYKNQLIYEQYAKGFDENTLQLGWSMTKSIMNTLVGILVQQGKIKINDKVKIAEWKNDDRKNITWNNLLQMSDGLDWVEDYTTISDATKMLYKEKDMYNYAINHKLVGKPGERYLYSSGTTNILSGLIKEEVGNGNYLAFPYDELFSKLGASSFKLETDASGTYVGSSYSWATPRDWAKYGLLYLNDGKWLNEQIIPKGWANYSGTPVASSKGGYGAQFWTHNVKEFPDVPSDMYFADGYQGQRVFIIPSKDLVVVSLGLTNGGKIEYNTLLKEILMSINN